MKRCLLLIGKSLEKVNNRLEMWKVVLECGDIRISESKNIRCMILA